MNVSCWIVLSHCIYRVGSCCLSVYLNIAALVLEKKRFEGPGKFLAGIFIGKRVGTLNIGHRVDDCPTS